MQQQQYTCLTFCKSAILLGVTAEEALKGLLYCCQLIYFQDVFHKISSKNQFRRMRQYSFSFTFKAYIKWGRDWLTWLFFARSSPFNSTEKNFYCASRYSWQYIQDVNVLLQSFNYFAKKCSRRIFSVWLKRWLGKYLENILRPSWDNVFVTYDKACRFTENVVAKVLCPSAFLRSLSLLRPGKKSKLTPYTSHFNMSHISHMSHSIKLIKTRFRDFVVDETTNIFLIFPFNFIITLQMIFILSSWLLKI